MDCYGTVQLVERLVSAPNMRFRLRTLLSNGVFSWQKRRLPKRDEGQQRFCAWQSCSRYSIRFRLGRCLGFTIVAIWAQTADGT